VSEFTDDSMERMLTKLRPYTVVILRKTPKRDDPGADRIVWEHGRRNFELRREGKLRIVCQMSDDGDVRGLCVFSTDVSATKTILDGDPAIRAGILTYELHSSESFSGDSL
jgi:hypothetical protein